MEILKAIINNPLFISAALGWFFAQFAKTIIFLILNKELRLERMIGNGGMPSSHSATVCALATATGLYYGFSGFEFAMASFFAIIVMNDAMGVRLETGKQAAILNDMIDWFRSAGQWKAGDTTKRLKEFVGHTPLQILVGAIIGITISIIYFNILH